VTETRGGSRRVLPWLAFVDQTGPPFSAVLRLLAKSSVERYFPRHDLTGSFNDDGPPGGVNEMLPGVRGKGDPDLALLFVVLGIG